MCNATSGVWHRRACSHPRLSEQRRANCKQRQGRRHEHRCGRQRQAPLIWSPTMCFSGTERSSRVMPLSPGSRVGDSQSRRWMKHAEATSFHGTVLPAFRRRSGPLLQQDESSAGPASLRSALAASLLELPLSRKCEVVARCPKNFEKKCYGRSGNKGLIPKRLAAWLAIIGIAHPLQVFSRTHFAAFHDGGAGDQGGSGTSASLAALRAAQPGWLFAPSCGRPSQVTGLTRVASTASCTRAKAEVGRPLQTTSMRRPSWTGISTFMAASATLRYIALDTNLGSPGFLADAGDAAFEG